MKRAACFLLALILVFSVVMPITTVQAVTGLDDAIAIPLVVKLLIASGLTFTSVAVAENVAQDFYSDPDNAALVGQNILLGKPFWTSTLDRLQLSFVVLDALWDAVIDYRDSNFSEGTNDVYDTQIVEDYITTFGTYWAFQNGSILVPDWYFTSGGHSWQIHFYWDATNKITCQYYYDGLPSNKYTNFSYAYLIFGSTYSVKVQCGTAYDNFSSTTNFRTVQESQTLVGNVYGESVCADGAWDYSNPYTGERSIDIPLTPEVPGVGTIGIGEDVFGLDTDALEDSYTDTYEDVTTEVAGVIPATEAQDIDTAGETDWTGTQEPGSESNTSLRALFFSKFPFCLPWDLMNAIKLLSEEPEAPHWEVDLMAPVEQNHGFSFVGDTTISLDMSEYPIVGQVCRWTSLIGFTISLIVLTRKIIRS